MQNLQNSLKLVIFMKITLIIFTQTDFPESNYSYGLPKFSYLALTTYCSQEDIITKLMEFLMEPHATTSDLLAEKEQVCHFINFHK